MLAMPDPQHPHNTPDPDPTDMIVCQGCGDPTPVADYDPRFGCLSCCDVAAFLTSAGHSTVERELLGE